MTTPEEFRALLDSPEGSRVEFKAASGGFHFDDLVKHCVALANEGGGRIVLGVTGGRNCTLFCTRVQCRCNCWQPDHPRSAARTGSSIAVPSVVLERAQNRRETEPALRPPRLPSGAGLRHDQRQL